MKIFFSTTPRAKNIYATEIERIYSYFDTAGIQLTDKIIRSITEKEFYAWNKKQREKYYIATINAIKKSDVCVFEASYPSLGVGHLINQALTNGKPVIVLYTNGKKPFMLDCAAIDKIALYEYNTENIEQILSSALEYASNNSDMRFDFFISPEMGEYLNKISRKKRIPRSVFLRSLIEKQMRLYKG